MMASKAINFVAVQMAIIEVNAVIIGHVIVGSMI
jgi:hypothetical protein